MAYQKRRLELNCFLCSHPITSTDQCLSEDLLQMVAEQNAFMNKTRMEHGEYINYVDIDHDQVIATKCGHMFHMGCIRVYVKRHTEKGGYAPCPLCQKGVTLTRVWPVLIPPTPAQLYQLKKMHEMKKQNTSMKVELQEIRTKYKDLENTLADIEKETEDCLTDIQLKQQQLDALNGPTEDELENLRKIHKQRQSIVRVVTQHNADLLGVLMHETNVQMSETDFEEGRDENCNFETLSQRSLKATGRARGRSRSKSMDEVSRNYRNKIREKFEISFNSDSSDDNNNNPFEPSFEEITAKSTTGTFPTSGLSCPKIFGRNININGKNKMLFDKWKSAPSKSNFLDCLPKRMSRASTEYEEARGQAVARAMARMPASYRNPLILPRPLGVEIGTVSGGNALSRKNGTRGLLFQKSDAFNGTTRSSVGMSRPRQLLPWGRMKPPLPPSSSNNSSSNKVRLRPKWC